MPEVIRAHRQRLKLSQADLAAAVGISTRQVGRYEKGEDEPGLSVAVKLADVFDISLGQLVGQEHRGLDLSGQWHAAWQTWKDGSERIDVHGLGVRQEGELLWLNAERAQVSVEQGTYAWDGELRLWDNDVLIGWYVSTEAAVRSKGSIYFKLHPHGLFAAGRWVGLSYDGDIITGFGAMAREASDAEGAVRDLIEQGGPLWTRSVT